jgi:hypothetical protein
MVIVRQAACRRKRAAGRRGFRCMPQAPFTDRNGDTQKIDRRINPIEVA